MTPPTSKPPTAPGSSRTAETRLLLGAALALALSLVVSHILASRVGLLRDYIGTVWLMMMLVWAASISSWLAKDRRTLGAGVACFGALGAIVGLSVSYPALVAGLLLLAALALGLCAAAYLLIAGGQLRLLSIPIALLAAAALSLLVGGYRQSRVPAVPAEGIRPELQLAYMRAVDQADRRSGLILLDSGRDAARLRRTAALDAAGKLHGPTAKWRAALIYQHGSCSHHFYRAYQLASEASRQGIPEASSLSRAAEDRWLLSIGQDQRHGTQTLHMGSDDCEGASL